MTETSSIYYHKPKIKKSNLNKETLLHTEYQLDRLVQEYDLSSSVRTPEPIKTMKKTAKLEPLSNCTVPKDSVFHCCVNTLRSLGLTGKYDGFMYICRAVEAILNDKEPPHFQSIYYDISKEYEVNSCSVERSIRYAINYIKRVGNYSKLSAIFGEALEDDKNFSNSRFLMILAADVYEKLTALELKY